MMDMYDILRLRIKLLRVENNITQSELAKMLFCNERTYRNYESGRSKVPIDILIRLAGIYDVSLEYFIKDNVDR